MHRIDTPSAQIDKFGVGKNGFTRGNPQTGVPATALDDDYFDAVQEELAGIVEAAGIILDKSNRAQVLEAIRYLIAEGIPEPQDASLTQKGIVQLSNSINSTSQVLAATPKAVNDAISKANSNLTGIVGTSRNAKMSIPVTLATATFTADELIVQTALGGLQYKLSGFNKTINLATVGAGGMDTGTVPVTGFVALYAIYNPTTQASALLAVNTTSVLAPEVYGGANIPSGYTASALVSVWRTAASKFVIGYQSGRSISIQNTVILSVTSNVTTPTIVSISSVVPVNANRVSGIGNIVIATAVGGNYSELNLFVDGNDVGTQRIRYAAPTIGEISSNYDLQMSSQSIYYTTLSLGGAIRSTVYISKYEF